MRAAQDAHLLDTSDLSIEEARGGSSAGIALATKSKPPEYHPFKPPVDHRRVQTRSVRGKSSGQISAIGMIEETHSV